jgi:teichuronic acid biosynthesis protein TuaE
MMLIIIVAAIFIILNTNSRLTYITIALMVISLLIYNLIKINLLNLSRFLAICFGIFLAYLIIRNLDPTILYKEINSILEMNSNSDFYAARAQIIKKGLVYFWNGNFIGLGAGGSMSLLRIPMHNIFLGILVDYGIFIFIYFIAVIGYTLYQLIIIYNEIKYSFEYKFYVLSCIFNILVMPLTMSISSDAISRKYTWVLFGIIFLFIKIYKEEIISLRQNKLNQKQYFFNKSRK